MIRSRFGVGGVFGDGNEMRGYKSTFAKDRYYADAMNLVRRGYSLRGSNPNDRLLSVRLYKNSEKTLEHQGGSDSFIIIHRSLGYGRIPNS